MDNFTVKMLKEGIQQLNLMEGIRYSFFFFWVISVGLIGVLFVAKFLTTRNSSFQPLLTIKNGFYARKYLSIPLATIALVISFLLLIFPAGIVSMGFFGDFLPAIVGMMASILLILDVFFNKKSEDDSEEGSASGGKLSGLLNKFLSLMGFVILIIVFVHIILPTVLFL